MNTQEQFFTLLSRQCIEGNFESKGSKFIAYLFALELSKQCPTSKIALHEYIESLREKHPKAVHFVSAMRVMGLSLSDKGNLALTQENSGVSGDLLSANDKQVCTTQTQIIESSSDDGEPKGSSGMPCLNVLRGEKLINVACVVVRYFGGTLLGVGGLVRAYTAATHDAIRNAKAANTLIPFVQKHSLALFIPYAQFSKVEYLAKSLDIAVFKQNFTEFGVEILCHGTQKALDTFKNKL